MSSIDAVWFASIREAAALIRSGEISSTELVALSLERIAGAGAALNACSVVLGDRARRDARARDREQRTGSVRGALHGLPVVVKDSVDVAGLPTAAGSLLRGCEPASRSAPALLALERAGAVLVAKTNMYELAYGGPSPAYGTVHNPWRAGRTTGGSSSGAAAAVAAGLAFAALASDSGGSIRIPAGFCGVAGYKPTRGRVPVAGVVPVSPTLDHVGPIARTAEDLALLMQALDGTLGEAVPEGVTGVRVGVADVRARGPVQAEVARALDGAEAALRETGADVRAVALPSFEEAREVKWTISGVEAAHTHRDLLARAREELQPAVRRLLEEGERVPGVEYVEALGRRRELRARLAAVFGEVDALLLPALPTSAFPEGAQTVLVGDRSEDALRSTTRFMSLFNVTGSPAATVPFGLDDDGLPIALQVAAGSGADLTALRVAAALQRLAGEARHPPEPFNGR